MGAGHEAQQEAGLMGVRLVLAILIVAVVWFLFSCLFLGFAYYNAGYISGYYFIGIIALLTNLVSIFSGMALICNLLSAGACGVWVLSVRHRWFWVQLVSLLLSSVIYALAFVMAH